MNICKQELEQLGPQIVAVLATMGVTARYDGPYFLPAEIGGERLEDGPRFDLRFTGHEASGGSVNGWVYLTVDGPGFQVWATNRQDEFGKAIEMLYVRMKENVEKQLDRMGWQDVLKDGQHKHGTLGHG